MARKKELEDFKKDIQEVNNYFAQFSNELIKLQKNGKSAVEIVERLSGQFEEASSKFKGTTGELREFSNTLDKSSKEYKNTTDAIKNLNGGMNALDSKFKKATKTTDTFGQAFRKQFSPESLGKSLGSLLKYVGGYKLFNTALDLVKNTTVAAAKANIEYEAELAKLEAVTGANSDEMKRLSDNILEVAGSTKFTSAEVVQLQTSLGKLGFSTQEIIDATQSIANVAQALGENAAPVAEKVGQILNQFNLTAAEATQVGDVLVGTINNSALSFESFGTAIQYVGPLAAEVGTDFVDLSGAMAVLADSGFTASRIGTGLRGILTELGTSGQDLTSIVEELAKEEISFAEAVDLVGKRSAAQLLTLIDNVDVLEEAEDRYEQTGAAIIASAKQIDTFKGNVELLNSAWNAFLINMGEFYNRAGLVRTALRILDSEAADTAEGLGLIADASPEIVGAGFDKAIFVFEELTKQGMSYAEALEQAQIAGATLISDDILKDNEEYNRKLQSRARLEAQGRTEGRAYALIQKEIRDIEIDQVNKLLAALHQEIEGQVLNTKLQNERNKIAEEYKGTFDGLVVTSKKLKDQAEAQTLTEKERLSFNKEVEEEINKLKERKARIEEGELKSLLLKQKANGELSESEKLRLNVLSAQADALDTQIGKFRNLEVLQGKQKKVAKGRVENFNDEIQALNLLIERQKKLLADRLAQNELERKALLNQLENAKSKEQQEAIQQRLNALAADDLSTQKASFLIIGDLIENYKEQLNNAGLTAEQTEKALQKIAKIEFKVGDLDIDIKEFAKVTKDLAKGFQEQFGKQLSSGDDLTPEQKMYVQKFLGSLFDSFGENLTDEQKGILTELLMSELLGDKKKGEKEVEKDLKERAKLIKRSIQDILEELGEVFDAYNDTALENTKARLDAELDAVRRKASVEQEILKSQLDNQLITESQFRTKSLELQKVQLAQENTIKKKIFDAEKNSDLRVVAAETAEAAASNILNNYESYDGITASVIGALSVLAILGAGAAKADAIRRRQFIPARFEEGGIVNGPSHAEGGVPFSVQGRGGYEMEGGEFIVNKRSTKRYRSLLENINNSHSINPAQRRFATGGMVVGNRDESVDYLKAIAEATSQSALQGMKPVRAFVSSKDLRSNETERRLRDRNDRV